MDQPAQTTNTIKLLSTKLSIPHLSSPHVLRRSLLDRLDAGLQQKLTLVSAPAGFGKTTMLIEWINERMKDEGGGQKAKDWKIDSLHPSSPILHPSKFAWVSLDSGDNDPARFWRYVFTAVQAFDEKAGSSALALLHASKQPHYEAVLTALINELAQRSGKDILVLEDYHLITNPQIHEAISFLLDHLPPALHLILLTRSDPPLPLARLRARNEINELRALDLRFTEAQTRDFLEKAIPQNALLSHPLSPEITSRLAARTEGWAAGLRLVTLALLGRKEPGEQEQFLDTFTGSHRPILEYLAADVLASQEASIQDFLLETSLLRRLNSSLCDAVTGRDDSALILQQLERANLFLEPLDGAGQWYRFHALFAEAMRYTAQQRLGEPRLRQLAHASSLWYEEHGMLSEAVEAALFAQTFARAADLIERIVGPRMVENEYHTLQRWMQNLPEDLLRAHPTLCMTYAQAILFTSPMGALVAADRLQAPLEMAEQFWAAEGNEPKLGGVMAFRALIAVRQGDYPRAFALARQALARLPEGEVEWRALSLTFTGWEEYYAGQLNIALQSLTEARALFQAVGNIYGLLDTTLGLGDVHARQAGLQQAAELYQQALAEIERAPINRQEVVRRQGRALLGLAALAYERNDLQAAEQIAAQAIAIGQENGGEEVLVHGSWILARLQRARNQIEPARSRLNALFAQIKRPLLLREIQAWQAWLALSAGDLAAVQRWSAARDQTADDLPILYQEQEALILARVQIAQGQAEAALYQLERWLADAQAKGRTRSELEIRILTAQAEAALDRLPHARQSLLQALALAQPDHFLRVFLDEGEPLRLLIEDCRLQIDQNAEKGLLFNNIEQILFSIHSPQQIKNQQSKIINLLEPLSQQEERVLRLLAAGLSNHEIAQELVVSVNTVKTHVKSIYRKLNVNSRRTAREAARRLKILS